MTFSSGSAMAGSVVLFSVPDLSAVPHLSLPPLSLAVLQHALRSIGIECRCHDLAPFGSRIAERLGSTEFQSAFGVLGCHDRGRSQTALVEISPELANAVDGSAQRISCSPRCGDSVPSSSACPSPAPLSPVRRAASQPAEPLAKAAKEVDPRCPVVVGGARALEIDHVRAGLMSEPSIDYLVRGSGDAALQQLAAAIASGVVDLSLVKGLVYRDGQTVRSNNGSPPWGHLAVPIWMDEDALSHYNRSIADLAPNARHVEEPPAVARSASSCSPLPVHLWVCSAVRLLYAGLLARPDLRSTSCRRSH